VVKIDAKKCDITGEYFDSEDEVKLPKYIIQRKTEAGGHVELDIHPKVYARIEAMFDNPDSIPDYASDVKAIKDELKKESLSDERRLKEVASVPITTTERPKIEYPKSKVTVLCSRDVDVTPILDTSNKIPIIRTKMNLWTPEDEKWLKENYATASWLDILENIKHPRASIYVKAGKLGIHKFKMPKKESPLELPINNILKKRSEPIEESVKKEIENPEEVLSKPIIAANPDKKKNLWHRYDDEKPKEKERLCTYCMSVPAEEDSNMCKACTKSIHKYGDDNDE